MKWDKYGLIIHPKGMEWMVSYTMVPIADYRGNDLFRIYFSSRDKFNRSMVGWAEINLQSPFQVLRYAEKPVLNIGELGCFDDNGVTPSWIVNCDGKKFLYYIGWKPRSTTRMSLVAGLAVSTDNGDTFTRVSRAPILKLTNREPFSILTAPCVLKEKECWKMWYVSGVAWKHADLPLYNIKYAFSDNGIEWEQKGITCIELSEDEVALARPCVIKENGKYRMWYSYKKTDRTYRIGYAESDDGIKWERIDGHAGIDVSKEGWDSEMIEYAFVFNHKGCKYMVYNGNDYGKTGIGLAILEK